VCAQDIVIGMSAPFTGPSKSLGNELYRGSMAYLEQVNRSGGIHGQKVVIKAYDDGYNPVPAIENTIKLIEGDRVFALFGYVGTAPVTRVLPLLKSYGEPVYLMFPFTGAQPQRQPPYDEYVFNLRASYRRETEGLVDNFVGVGRKRIAVFYQADAYGRSGWDGVRRALAKNHLKLIAEATYRRGTSYEQKLGAQVDILKNADPDAIISVGSYGACAAFIRDARDAGWTIPIANVSFVGSESLAALLLESSRANGRDYSLDLINSQVVPSYEDTSLPAVREYREAMVKFSPLPPPGLTQSEYKPSGPGFVSFEGFLNAKLLVEILKKMGAKPARSRIKEVAESIRNLDLGIDAPISFTANQHQGLAKVFYTTLRGDQFVPLANWERWKK
jgi:ABC-type branched-subunit amino acid transport system substrate-binding protein